MSGWSRVVDDTNPIQVGLRAVIVLVLLAGLAFRNVSVVVNAAMALVVTSLPALLRRDYEVHLGMGLTTWITMAVTLHSVGMLALYDTIPWWDHLTHLFSGALVAGVGYAIVRVVDKHTDAIALPGIYLGLFIVLFTIAAGVVWEVLEQGGREIALALDMEPILQVHGVDDTALDLLFDGIGGLIVAVWGGHYLEGTVERIAARLQKPS